ncbi:WbqC family protein [Streptomyces sp. NPDC057575]|uniref:WbqC family protein n=1 Tax=unclassified Streptomyces TaxID=2593676 RepID=UPI0036809DD6
MLVTAGQHGDSPQFIAVLEGIRVPRTAVGFSPDSDPAAAGLVCAIHQPNLLPRLSTVAKILAADVWIVLDDVQFARRDFQH